MLTMSPRARVPIEAFTLPSCSVLRSLFFVALLTTASRGQRVRAPSNSPSPSGIATAPEGCTRSGLRPDPECVSWRDGVCEYNRSSHPAWADSLVIANVASYGGRACSSGLNTSCINTTCSARVFAALACVEEGAANASLVEYELMALPAGQFRLSDSGVELVVSPPDSHAPNRSRVLVDYSCSAIIAHTCTRESTGFVFDSRYDATTGTTLKYTEDWQRSPTSVVYLKNNELMKWIAVCSRSSVSVTKKHVFRAGGNSIVYRETTRGRSTKTVYVRCIALNAFCIDFGACA